MTGDIQRRLELARRIAVEAGRSTLAYFRHDDLSVDLKADNSPVTVADRQAETLLRERILDAFPGDGILGEEFGVQEGTSPFRWILDPIDGTKSFITGVPLYGTLIGIECEGRSEAGVIYVPGSREGVFAARGGGAFAWEGEQAERPAAVSRRRLSDGVFLTSQIDTFARRGAGDAFHELESIARITRTWGDCYGYLLVATGRAEAMVDAAMSVWDAAALQPILEEAGGHFTDWRGTATIHGEEGVGCTAAAQEQVLAVTRRFPRPEPV